MQASKLMNALVHVATVADDLDDQLKDEIGGKSFAAVLTAQESEITPA